MGKTYIRNPGHPEVAQWYHGYLAALLKDYGSAVDGFVWDETYYVRAGDIMSTPAPAYCARAMLDLIKALAAQVTAHDPEKVFLSSDDVGIFGRDDAVGYAMVAHGNYQDSWCEPAAWSYALFPNWPNTSWSCNWWSVSRFHLTRWGVEHFGVPVAISNGWENDRGPSEWTTTYQSTSESAATWGVKNYAVEVWDDSSQNWKRLVDENQDRIMATRLHTLQPPVKTARFRVVVTGVASSDNVARLLQVEAWGPKPAP